jgi:hypothetical protein
MKHPRRLKLAAGPVRAENLVHVMRPGDIRCSRHRRVCLRARYRSRSTGSGSGFSGAAACRERCCRVLIVMGLVFGLHPPHIGLVPDEGAVQDLASCTAPEFGALDCDLRLGRLGACARIGVHDPSPALPDRDPRVRLAGLARPRAGVQGRGDPDVAARGGGAAASGRPAEAGLDRPGGHVRAGPAAGSSAANPAARHAWDAASLAPPPCRALMDLSQPAGTACG